MIGLVDTSVVVDFIRNYRLSLQWFATTDTLGISSIAYMEVIEGARDSSALRVSLVTLKRLQTVYLTEEDQQWAQAKHRQYKLSHNVGLADCLIASVSQRLELPLYTLNLKHMRPVLGDLAVKPY